MVKKEKTKQFEKGYGSTVSLLLIVFMIFISGCFSGNAGPEAMSTSASAVPSHVVELARRMDLVSARAAAQSRPIAQATRPSSLLGDIAADIEASRRGREIFHNTSFGSIDNLPCAGCHIESQNWQITPAFVREEFARNPNSGIFRFGHNADVEGGSTFSRLFTTATFLVPFTLPATGTVSLPGCGTSVYPNARLHPNGDCTVFMPRSAGSIRNMALHEMLLWDGRETTLAAQAVGAVNAHNLPLSESQLPNLQQRADLQAFQQIVPFSSLSLRLYAYSERYGGSVSPPGLPVGRNESARRGRAFFEAGCAPGTPGCPAQGIPSGMCAQCHGNGALLNEAAWDNILPSFRPDGTPEPSLGNNFVSEFNMTGFQVYEFVVREPVDPPGSPPRIVRSSDPGLLLTTGSLCNRSFLNCVLNPGSGLSIFRTSSLRGIRQKIEAGVPFFHNNSAPNIEAVMAHYVQFGQLTAFLIQQSGQFPPGTAERFLLSPQNVADIIEYMREL